MDITINGNVISIDDKSVTEALESKQPLSVESDLVVKTQAQQKEWFDNQFNEAKSGTIKTSEEKLLKSLRDKYKIELPEGGKNWDTLFETYSNQLKDKYIKEPNKQLEDKEKDFQILRNEFENERKEKETLQNNFKSYKDTNTINKDLRSNLPKELAYHADDMELIIKNRMQPSVDDNGRTIWSVGGDILKDPTTGSPLQTNKVFENFFSENQQYLKGVTGGQGGRDSTQGSPKEGLEGFNERYTATGGNIGEPRYQRELVKFYQEQANK